LQLKNNPLVCLRNVERQMSAHAAGSLLRASSLIDGRLRMYENSAATASPLPSFDHPERPTAVDTTNDYADKGSVQMVHGSWAVHSTSW